MQTVELRARNKRVTFEVDPTDHIGRHIVRGHFYEMDLLEDIGRRVKPGLAVDVGAHIGNHSLYLASILGLSVVALEPSNENRVSLERNIASNALAQAVRVIPAAAGANPGFCRTVNGHPGNTGMTRAVYGDGDIPVVTIDSLNLAGVSLIKIDTEGCELDVLAGAQETIKREKPIVYVESVETHERVKSFMSGLGYKEFGCYAKTPTYGYEPRAEVKPVSLSVSVMAHPKRAGFVESLTDRLDVGQAVNGVQVIWDQKNDRWDTGSRSLLAYDPGATHHMVIQDDAVIPHHLIEATKRLLETKPHSPVSLYTGRQRPNGPTFLRLAEQARIRNASWIMWHQLCWGVGLVFPAEIIEKMLAGAQAHIPNYDMRLSVWLESKHIPTLYTVPSLVDHRRQSESPSLVPGRTGENRVAHRYIGDTDPRTLDWDGPVITRGVSNPYRKCHVCGAPDYACSGD